MVTNYQNSALVPTALEFIAVLRMRFDEWGKADEVMRRLDFVYEDQLSRWVPFEESMRLRGFEKVDGTWLIDMHQYIPA